MLSGAARRTYEILSGLVGRYVSASGGYVRLVLVFAGLHCRRPAALLIGISDFATLELNGPTTPMTLVSLTSVDMFFAPCWGSWAPFTASSWTLIASV